LLSPTIGYAAYPLRDELPGRDLSPNTRRTCQFNLTGSPAVSVPCGFTADGLPIGMQLIGPHFSDARLLRVAQAYQDATLWRLRQPPIQ
jgi:aspartyl-tRNA(Asn)/glutamyl-tRNA(Gln) amidotransferase subunit A